MLSKKNPPQKQGRIDKIGTRRQNQVKAQRQTNSIQKKKLPAGGKETSRRMKGNTRYSLRMSLEFTHRLYTVNTPQLHCPIVATGGSVESISLLRNVRAWMESRATCLRFVTIVINLTITLRYRPNTAVAGPGKLVTKKHK